MLYSAQYILLFLILAIVSTSASAQTNPFDGRSVSFESPLKVLVRTRSQAIEAAFPGFAEMADFTIAVGSVKACPHGESDLACYDAENNILTFTREVHAAADARLLYVADNYWAFYENEVLRESFPIIAFIDRALWTAFMSEIALKFGATWPHEDCGSVQLSKRLGCEMLRSGIQSTLRFRHSRIFNANRLDRLWPDNLGALEESARLSRSREYADVRDLGGTQLLQPLIEEFGAARVFAYVAQTPFSIEENNVRASALRYQEVARSALGW